MRKRFVTSVKLSFMLGFKESQKLPHVITLNVPKSPQALHLVIHYSITRNIKCIGISMARLT